MSNNNVINNTNNSLGSALRNSCSKKFILFSSNKPGFIKKGIRWDNNRLKGGYENKKI